MHSLVAETYIIELQKTYATGCAGEHAYRPALDTFFEAVVPKLHPVNDPKRSEHRAPDVVFIKGDLTAGYAETKDFGEDLNKNYGR